MELTCYRLNSEYSEHLITSSHLVIALMMEVSNLGDPKDATAAALAEGACIMTEVEGPAPVRSPLNKTVARLGKVRCSALLWEGPSEIPTAL